MLLHACHDGRHGQGHRALRDGRPHREARGGAPSPTSSPNQGAGKMSTYSLSTPKIAVSRSNFLRVAAMLSSVVVAIGYAGPVSADPLSIGARSPAMVYSPSPERTLLAQASGEDTMTRCQQLFALYDRLNSDGYARPLDARMALEDCRKGNIAKGVAELKRVLERRGIPVPPTETATTPGRSMSR
jgi:hypothetical protein